MTALRFAGFRTGTMTCYFLLALLLACTPIPDNKRNAPDIGDGGFMSGEPCGPPCFWNIIPGITREGQLIDILRARGVLEHCNTFNHEAESGWRGYFCVTFSLSFQRGSDVVRVIGFSQSRRITLGEVIAKYGEPDGVSVGAIGLPEKPKIVMNLFYRRIHTILGLDDQEGSIFVLKDSTMIKGISYDDDESFEFETKIPDRIKNWKGYGTYQRGD